ncbi:MAG: hypothetical protein WCV84_05220 [Patescibacteria group bacterium]
MTIALAIVLGLFLVALAIVLGARRIASALEAGMRVDAYHYMGIHHGDSDQALKRVVPELLGLVGELRRYVQRQDGKH